MKPMTRTSEYTILFDMSSPREAVSRLSKILIIAIVCLLLALVEQVVGYATNYWMVKGFGSSVYHLDGLWNTCFCSSSCYCSARDSSGDNRIRVACVFETLGLAGLVAVLALTVLGVFKDNYKLVIKVASAVAGFVTGALILAGVVGIGVTAASDPYIALHFSFALCAKAGGMTILAAFLLIVDIRPRFRAQGYRDYVEEKKDTENKKQSRQKPYQRPTTLGEYISQQNTEPGDENRQNKKADNLARRKKKDRQLKQQSEIDQYTNKGLEDDGYSNDDTDGGFEQRKKTEDKFQTKRNRDDKYAYRKHSAELYDNAYAHHRQYSNEAAPAHSDENNFNEIMQYAQMNSLRNENETENQHLDKYDDVKYSNQKSAEYVMTQNVDLCEEDQIARTTNLGEYSMGQYEDQNKYPSSVDPKYHQQVTKTAVESDLYQSAEPHNTTNNRLPQLKRSPNASESRRQTDWGNSRYDYGNQNNGSSGNQPVQVVHNYRRRGQLDYYSSQPSPTRNLHANTYGQSDPVDRNIVLPSSYSEPRGTSYGSRSKQGRSNETEV